MSWIRGLFKRWTYQVFAPGALVRAKYEAFRELLRQDHICLGIIADLEGVAYGFEKADRARAVWLTERLIQAVEKLTSRLLDMNPSRYMDLPEYTRKIAFYARMALDRPLPEIAPPYVLPLSEAAAYPGLCGGKAANLGRVTADTELAVPPGFVVTTRAFNYFIEACGLREPMDKLLRRIQLSHAESLQSAAAELMELVLHAEVPEAVAREIVENAAGLAAGGRRLAVRSSALVEDGDISFAGQYASELNVAAENVLEAYKRVLAGKYCNRALAYRVAHGLTDQETAMAVLVLPMVDPAAAGVLYTRDPQACPVAGGDEVMSVFAVPGLGETLVDGSRTPQRLLMGRHDIPQVHAAEGRPLLTTAQADALRRAGLALEELFGRPQDVEWALDKTGRLFILQSRPFHMDSSESMERGQDRYEAPVLVVLERASAVCAAFPVYFARQGKELSAIPEGAVVVTPTLTPALALFAGKAAAVLAEHGSRASHFASIAREKGLPVAVGPKVFEALRPGETVTVDAFSGRVYAGRVECLLGDSRAAAGRERIEPAYEALAQVTVKLNLIEPSAPDFTPAGCRSLHDVVRFCHEKSVAEMFSLVGRGGRGLGQSKLLKTDLPLVMYVLDLGGGLFSTSKDKDAVEPDDITSAPMWAFWWGLVDPGVGWSSVLHVDWEEFDRVSGGIFNPKSRLLASYAILAADYVHLMLRFGYHFAVLDALCGPDVNANYVRFRFKGGGGNLEQRMLRLEFIKAVLERNGFGVETTGDMLDANFMRRSDTDTNRALVELGALAASTRLMDMGLRDMGQVQDMVRAHLERRARQLGAGGGS